MTPAAKIEFGTMIASDDIPVPEGMAIRWLPAEGMLDKHLAVFGGTRYGKSKLFEQICRELLLNGSGFAFIDPHSDTADDLLAYIAFHHDSLGGIAKRLHYLNPTKRLFSFDPFQYRPDPDVPNSDTEHAYQSWLHRKTKHMARIIVRKQGETEAEAQKTVRLRRWLGSALYAVGVRQNAEGTHLPLTDALVLLRPSHTQYPKAYGRVEPFLTGEVGEEVHTDLEMLRKTHSQRQQEDWVESAINRLRDVFSPTVRRMFSLEAPTINFRDIIQRGGIILASLGAREQPAFDQEEGQVIAGLLIREISDAVRAVDRSKRKQFYLFMDEAQNFLGEDLMDLLKESGKYKLSVGMAVQSLDNLQKGEVDLVPAVLGQCGIRITFRQKFHEHAEVLAQNLGCSLLDFKKLFHIVERDGGYNWVLVPSVSNQTNWAETESQSTGTSHTSGEGSGTGVGETHNASHAEISEWLTGTVQQLTKGATDGTTRSKFESSMYSDGTTQSKGQSKTKGGGESISWSPTPLHVTREETQDTGRLETSIDDQHAKITNIIQRLPKQVCFAAMDDEDAAFLLKVVDVRDPFVVGHKTEWTKAQTIKSFLDQLFETHPYYFAAASKAVSGDVPPPPVATNDDPFFPEE